MSHAGRVIEQLRAQLYQQSVVSVLAGGWDLVAEVRVCPEDYARLLEEIPPFNGEPGSASPRFSIRIVVDKHLRPDECIKLDAQGNIIGLDGDPRRLRTTSAQEKP